jgi:uncharacterized membrane protein YoaK (UPF0700 family)
MTIAATHTITPSNVRIATRRVLSLGFVAGYINAVGFIDLGSSVAAMTGNTVQLGIGLEEQKWSYIWAVGTTLVAFFLGGLISSYVRRRLLHPAIELILMALMLMAAQLARSTLHHPLVIELLLLASSMALQGETLSRFGCLPVQTIVATHNLLKLADGLVGWFIPLDKVKMQPGDILLPACAWAAYAIGAAAAAFLTTVNTLPFLLPAIVLVITTIDLLVVPVPAEDAVHTKV